MNMEQEAARIREALAWWAKQNDGPLFAGQRVRVVDSGVRLRSRKFIGRLGRVVSGPAQWQNGQSYQVALGGDFVKRTMFRDELTPAYGFDAKGRDLGKGEK